MDNYLDVSFIFGPAFLLVAFFLLKPSIAFFKIVKENHRVTVTVIDVVELDYCPVQLTRRDRSYFHAYFQWTINGITRERFDSAGASSPVYQVGEELSFVYDKDDPSTILRPADLNLKIFIILVFGGLGAYFLINDLLVLLSP